MVFVLPSVPVLSRRDQVSRTGSAIRLAPRELEPELSGSGVRSSPHPSRTLVRANGAQAPKRSGGDGIGGGPAGRCRFPFEENAAVSAGPRMRERAGSSAGRFPKSGRPRVHAAPAAFQDRNRRRRRYSAGRAVEHRIRSKVRRPKEGRKSAEAVGCPHGLVLQIGDFDPPSRFETRAFGPPGLDPNESIPDRKRRGERGPRRSRRGGWSAHRPHRLNVKRISASTTGIPM